MEFQSASELKRYYIAYVDLLGYKDFFQKHSDQVLTFLQTISSAVGDIKCSVASNNQAEILQLYGPMNIIVKIFSDNIILCLEIGEAKIEVIRLLTFLSLVADIQRTFIVKYGLFLRGGITCGDISINDDFVFGQGLIDAVEMEAKANYPRIVIARSIVEFLFQRHYISDSELQCCADLASKFQRETFLSHEEQALLEAYAPRVSNELFNSLWKYNLVIEDADGVSVLNYLYNLNAQTMVLEDQWNPLLTFLNNYFPHDYDMVISANYNAEESLQIHKEKVKEKLLEYGRYDDIMISDINGAEAREKVLKKYLWVMKFHNFIAKRENALECMINAQVNCDGRYMKMRVIVVDDINDTMQ